LVDVTVCFATIRSNPHFDWLFKSLSKQSFKNFEVVVIDDRASLERYKEVRALSQTNNVLLGYYGESKPSRWKGVRGALCNARNSAIAIAHGQHLVWMDDNGYATPQWLEYHMIWGRYGLSEAGTWVTFHNGQPSEIPVEVRGLPGKHYYQGNIGPYGFEGSRKQINAPLVCEPTWLYGGNMGFPLSAALAVNGFDEMYDGEQGVDDCDFAIRIRRAGYKQIFDPRALVYYNITSHHLTQNEVAEVKPDKALIPREKMSRKPKEKMLRDGKMHFSNELLIQNLRDDRTRVRANPNFDLVQLREQFVKTGKLEHPLGPERDWRDNALISEMT